MFIYGSQARKNETIPIHYYSSNEKLVPAEHIVGARLLCLYLQFTFA